MRAGIRSRLVLAFILIIVLPLGMVGGSLLFASLRLNNSATDQQLAQIDQNYEAVVEQLMENYSLINDYEKFDAALKPLLNKYGLTLRIVGTSNELLYDSRDKEGSKEHKIIKNGLAESLGFQRIIAGKYYTTMFPIAVNGQRVANAMLNADMTKTPYSVIDQAFVYTAISLGVGLVVLISLVILSTWYISRTVLKPLKELSQATEQIAEGDLDFAVTYDKDDEFGRFSRAFDLMRRKLKDSLEKQRDYERARIEMIASISHDLRTPISSVKGYVEGLMDGVADDKEMTERYLSVIKRKTEQFDRLIEDLFQFSQLELGRIEIKPVMLDSRVLLEDILDNLQLEFDHGPLRLNVIKPIPSVSVKADGQRIEQIIANLVDNARRYASQTGLIEVGANIEKDCLVVTVKDHGPGIPADDLPYIFDRFYRGEKSRSREYGGTGLGLAICKYLIESHGGQIWVESTEGEGSVFSFSIPSVDQVKLDSDGVWTPDSSGKTIALVSES